MSRQTIPHIYFHNILNDRNYSSKFKHIFGLRKRTRTLTHISDIFIRARIQYSKVRLRKNKMRTRV